jgi:hypothetical protein
MGLPTFARISVSERADDREVGREGCNQMLYGFHGSAQTIERIRALLVSSYSIGILANSNTQVSAMQVSKADVEVVQILATELDLTILEAVSEYTNGNMTSAFLEGHPGQLDNKIRKRSARSIVFQAPWLKDSQRDSLVKEIEKLIGQ